MSASDLRAIPSVEKVLHALGDTGLPARSYSKSCAENSRRFANRRPFPTSLRVLAGLRASLEDLRASRIQPVINGTGILIHTNFGRAPLGPEVVERLSAIGSNYNNLEYALGGGSRGGRAAYLERGLALLCAAEAATVVNNNAAALVLILRYFCESGGGADRRRSRIGARERPGPKNEVIISRGELIQIGGGFRIPEILESSGALLARSRHDKQNVAERLRSRDHAPDGADPESAPQQFFHGWLRSSRPKPKRSQRWRAGNESRSSKTSAAVR